MVVKKARSNTKKIGVDITGISIVVVIAFVALIAAVTISSVLHSPNKLFRSFSSIENSATNVDQKNKFGNVIATPRLDELPGDTVIDLCGNGLCDRTETITSCPDDCKPVVCIPDSSCTYDIVDPNFCGEFIGKDSCGNININCKKIIPCPVDTTSQPTTQQDPTPTVVVPTDSGVVPEKSTTTQTPTEPTVKEVLPTVPLQQTTTEPSAQTTKTPTTQTTTTPITQETPIKDTSKPPTTPSPAVVPTVTNPVVQTTTTAVQTKPTTAATTTTTSPTTTLPAVQQNVQTTQQTNQPAVAQPTTAQKTQPATAQPTAQPSVQQNVQDTNSPNVATPVAAVKPKTAVKVKQNVQDTEVIIGIRYEPIQPSSSQDTIESNNIVPQNQVLPKPTKPSQVLPQQQEPAVITKPKSFEVCGNGVCEFGEKSTCSKDCEICGLWCKFKRWFTF